jgi:hypothetical protein
MKFLNKKEQVIDLEVTPYGKSLLARGRFKPEFYAFFDGDILYDSQYGAGPEHQNSASVRIREMPQLETQAYFYGAESQVNLATEFHRLSDEEKNIERSFGREPMDINTKPYVADDDVTIGTIPDREFDGTPLGKSQLNSSYAPAWNINVMKGEISSSTQTLPNWSNVQRIPQLNMKELLYTLKLSTDIESDNYYQFKDTNGAALEGSVLNLIGDSIILEIDEENTDFEWENFDIEVLEVETKTYSGSLDDASDDVEKEFLKPLFFKKQMKQVQNGILYEPGELPEQNTIINPNYSEYYFDILVDKEIDQALLCELNPPDKAQGIFSKRELDCSEVRKQDEIDIEDLYEGDDFEDECD